MTKDAEASHGFPSPIGAVSQPRAGFGGRDAENTHADRVVLIATIEHDERAFEGRLIHIRRKRIPMKAVNVVEQAVELHQVELKIDVQHFAIAAAADEFGRTEVQPHFPAVRSGFAIEADAAHVGKRLEHLGNLFDEPGDPLRTDVAPGSRPGGFNLLQEMFDRQMRMTHETANSTVLNKEDVRVTAGPPSLSGNARAGFTASDPHVARRAIGKGCPWSLVLGLWSVVLR